MDWFQFAIFILTNAGIFWWARSDYNTLNSALQTQSLNTQNLIISIKDEMKEFHGKLEKQDAEFKAGLLRLEELYLKDRKLA